MTPQLVALADTPPQPWRNGGGVTRELLAWPAGGDWQVRVSVADIEADGPFSRFPGVERWFAVLRGRRRRADDRRRRAPPAAPATRRCRFDGAAPVDCRLLDGADAATST